MLAYILLVIGLYFLMLGGDWLVKGSVGLAERFGIPPLIIGLTIVAFGTSAPEMVISFKAALDGSGGLAIGNVVGSNIANVLLVLGFPALIASTVASEKGMKTTIGFLIAVTFLFIVFLETGELTRVYGICLLVCLGLFLFQQYRSAARQIAEEGDTALNYAEDVGELPKSIWAVVGYVVIGLVALPVAANLTVNSAVSIAEFWNVPEDIIGLTIIAIGTSLPELATGISAARAGNTSVAVGNVIGSNLFNIAAIMGLTAAFIPIQVSQHVMLYDVWVMAATTIFLIALPLFGLRIGRRLGSVMLVLYAAYLVFTVVS